MNPRKPIIRRRSMVTSTMDSLVTLLKKVTSTDAAYSEFAESPFRFAKKAIRNPVVFELLKTDGDFREMIDLAKTIRAAAKTGKLDLEFLFSFAEVRGTTPNYQQYSQTHYNFDQSSSSEASYGKDGISTKPGYMSQTSRRLHNSFASDFEGKPTFALADKSYGPMLSERLLRKLKKIEAHD